MRRIERHQTYQPSNQPRRGQRQHPSHKDVRNLLPIHGTEIIIHQRNPDHCTREALRRTNRQRQTRGHQHRNRRAKLSREPSCRGHLCDSVAECADDLEAVEPEACAEEEAGDHEEPDGGRGFGLDVPGPVGLVAGDPGADGVGDVVGAVRNRHKHGGEYLAVGPEVLNTDVVVGGFGVDAGRES
jgi:hypothetical protein